MSFGRGGSCGGTILDKKTVLSAAHCFENGYSRVQVEVGFTNHRDSPQKFNVKSVEMHPEYNPRILDFDVAILKLSFPLIWTDYVQPACLPDASFTPEENGQKGFISGWGTTKYGMLCSSVIPFSTFKYQKIVSTNARY